MTVPLKHPTDPKIKKEVTEEDRQRERREERNVLWLLAQGNETLKRWHYQHVGWEIQWDCCCLYFWRCRSICVCMCMCVCDWERNRWCQSEHLCVCVCVKERKWQNKKQIDGGNGGKTKIFHTSPTSLEPIIQSFSKTVNLYGGAILGYSHKKLLFKFPPLNQDWKYFFLTHVIMINALRLVSISTCWSNS